MRHCIYKANHHWVIRWRDDQDMAGVEEFDMSYGPSIMDRRLEWLKEQGSQLVTSDGKDKHPDSV